MNPEKVKLFKECKAYLIRNEEKYIYEVADNAPEEIKDKWKKYNELEDDLIIEDSTE